MVFFIEHKSKDYHKENKKSTYEAVRSRGSILQVTKIIYGSVSEAGEFGPSHTVKVDAFTF